MGEHAVDDGGEVRRQGPVGTVDGQGVVEVELPAQRVGGSVGTGGVEFVEDLHPHDVVGLDVAGTHPLPDRGPTGEVLVAGGGDVEHDVERGVGALVGPGATQDLHDRADGAGEELAMGLGVVDGDRQRIQLHHRPDRGVAPPAGPVVHGHPHDETRSTVESADRDRRRHRGQGEEAELG